MAYSAPSSPKERNAFISGWPSFCSPYCCLSAVFSSNTLTPSDLLIQHYPEPLWPGSKLFLARVKSIMPPGLLITRRREAGKYDRGGPDTRKVSRKRTEERLEAEEGEIRGERRRRDLKESKKVGKASGRDGV